jgi:hypothetical protein
MERSKKVKKLIRTKKKQPKMLPDDLRDLRKAAVKFFPHIRPVLYDISIETLLYHLPNKKTERLFRKKLITNDGIKT